MKINQAVGFRLVTKFGECGVINLHYAIPILGGIVGGSVDAFSTYAIAKAAKALFLGKMIDQERHEETEFARMQILINMALVDGIYAKEESDILRLISNSLCVKNEIKDKINNLIANPQQQNVDLSLFKKDQMLSACLLGTLNDIIMADGKMHMAEKIYFKNIAKQLGYTEEMLKDLLA